MRADVALLIEPEPEPESLELLSAAPGGPGGAAGGDSPMTTLREVRARLFVLGASASLTVRVSGAEQGQH